MEIGHKLHLITYAPRQGSWMVGGGGGCESRARHVRHLISRTCL